MHNPPQPFAFTALPGNVQTEVLQLAGLHTRHVCRAFRALHAPPRSFAPHGITTSAALSAAVAALPPALTSLDLSFAEALITPAALAQLPTHAPGMQRLVLPRLPPDTIPSVSAILHRLPHLHTLHVPAAFDLPDPTAWAPLRHPDTATRLVALTLALDALETLANAPAATFPRLTSLILSDVSAPQLHATAAHAAALSAAAPALRSLAMPIREYPSRQDGPRLATAFSALTSLSLQVRGIGPTAHLLSPLATLTALRSLALRHEPTEHTPQATTWLQRLTLLTHLLVTFTFEPTKCRLHHWDNEDQAKAAEAAALQAVAQSIEQVAQAAAVHLPLLRHLRQDLAGEMFWRVEPGKWPAALLSCGTPRSSFRRLAAATQLVSLVLCRLPLPPQEACHLTCLQSLTFLAVVQCDTLTDTSAEQQRPPGGDGTSALPHGGGPKQGLHWVAALQSLRRLAIAETWAGPLLHGPASASLPQLTSLSLQHLLFCKGELGDVWGVLRALRGVLVRLTLQGLPAVGPAVLRVLAGMECLEALDLSALGNGTDVVGLARELQLPPCVRCCCLDAGPAGGPGVDQALARLRERHPLVDFRVYGRQA